MIKRVTGDGLEHEARACGPFPSINRLVARTRHEQESSIIRIRKQSHAERARLACGLFYSIPSLSALPISRRERLLFLAASGASFVFKKTGYLAAGVLSGGVEKMPRGRRGLRYRGYGNSFPIKEILIHTDRGPKIRSKISLMSHPRY